MLGAKNITCFISFPLLNSLMRRVSHWSHLWMRAPGDTAPTQRSRNILPRLLDFYKHTLLLHAWYNFITILYKQHTAHHFPRALVGGSVALFPT